MKKTLLVMIGFMVVQSGSAALVEMFPQEEKAKGGILQMAAPKGDVLRKRQASPLAVNRTRPVPQDQAVYPFFNGATYTTTVTRVSQGFGGAEIVEGKTPGSDMISLSIYTPGGERHEVHFTESGRVYLAVTLPNGTMEMQEHDPSLAPRWDEHVENVGGDPGEEEGEEGVPALAAGNVEIDVMMVFDTTAYTWAQSNGGITNLANSAINRMNTALSNSGIACTMRLADIYCPNYTYGGDMNTALNDVTKSLGGLSGVAAQRNAVGADVVSLMVDTGSAYGTTGIGWVSPRTAAYAFSVCAVRAVNTGHTMSHEIGHNLGCGHSKNQASNPGPTTGIPYAAGWYFTGSNNTRYHTIMAYNNDGTLSYTSCNYFSTPLKLFQGVAVGHATDGDNARCFSEQMTIVAGYRTPPTIPSPPATATASGGTYTDKVRVTWSSVTGATSYKVYRHTSNNSASATLIATVSSPTLQHDDTAASVGAIYYYWVKASNSVGDSAFSTVTQGYRALPAPTTVTASNSYADKIQITWSSVTGATSYKVYCHTANNSSGASLLATVSSPTLQYDDTTASPGITYYYWVRASNGITDGAFSTSAIGLIPLPTLSFAEALNNTLTWTTGGNQPWLTQTQTTHDGLHAAQSGTIGNNQVSWLETTVTGPGTLTFWWCVSSHSSIFLTCKTNGASFSSISGTPSSWAQKSITLPPGQTTIRWEYNKTRNSSTGSDCGWLDEVTWTPRPPFTQTTPVPVPISWLDEMYPGNNGDYETLALQKGGNGYFVWESYVAGLVPTNAASTFRVSRFEMNGAGITAFDWTPHCTDRTYKVWGKTNLTDHAWGPTNSATHFFKVSVDL